MAKIAAAMTSFNHDTGRSSLLTDCCAGSDSLIVGSDSLAAWRQVESDRNCTVATGKRGSCVQPKILWWQTHAVTRIPDIVLLRLAASSVFCHKIEPEKDTEDLVMEWLFLRHGTLAFVCCARPRKKGLSGEEAGSMRAED